ncbi:hypothetical protein [Roseibium marinum]|uniref:Flagellar assembly protein FliH n=1 Tax=Roseibium marinum TaxID=281252 RepID=A0A2S3UR02_9HYPH|nr:hypothetical protein [Roseibium marinum]POF30145.1 hypothetical protein CLV41_107172 [Roseibium marinum]
MTMSAASHIPVITVPKFKSYGAYDPALVDVLEPEDEQAPEPSEEERRQAEYERGLAEGEARMHAHYGSLLENEREGHAKALEDEKTRFDMRESANVSAAIEGFLDVMEQRIAYSLAKLLQPFLNERITEQLVTAFAGHLRQLTQESDGKLIRLRGPDSLTGQVMAQLPDLRERIEVQVADQVELVALFDETTIETRLEQWLGQLEILRKEAD